MALTEPQMMSVFDILEIPHCGVTTGQLYAVTPAGDAYMSGNSWDAICMAKAISGVYAWVDGMSGSGLDRLTGLISRYDALGDDTSRLDNGTVGDVNGITWSASDQRNEIARKVRNIVPFYRKHDEIMRNRSGKTIFVS